MPVRCICNAFHNENARQATAWRNYRRNSGHTGIWRCSAPEFQRRLEVWNYPFDLLSFVLTQKKVTKKKSRLYKNFLFSTGRLIHAIQAAPSHRPTLASVSLSKAPLISLPSKTTEIFIWSSGCRGNNNRYDSHVISRFSCYFYFGALHL